jgi:hypothetical protein
MIDDIVFIPSENIRTFCHSLRRIPLKTLYRLFRPKLSHSGSREQGRENLQRVSERCMWTAENEWGTIETDGDTGLLVVTNNDAMAVIDWEAHRSSLYCISLKLFENVNVFVQYHYKSHSHNESVCTIFAMLPYDWSKTFSHIHESTNDSKNRL